jgi:hypothetical protein
MGLGPGVVQRRLVAALQAEPKRRFTVDELAEIVFPGELIERKHEVSVRRVLKDLPGLDLHFRKVGRAAPWLALSRVACRLSVASSAAGCNLECVTAREALTRAAEDDHGGDG